MTRQKAKYSGLLPVVFVAAIVAVSVVLLSCGPPPPTINLTMYTYPNANNACAQVTISDINSSSQVFFTTDGTTPQLSVGGSTVLLQWYFPALAAHDAQQHGRGQRHRRGAGLYTQRCDLTE